jgi:hypothetical protein
MSQQLQLFKKELNISEMLRSYGKQFRQIQMRYSDGLNGRCALGVIMSYFGWDGRENIDAANDILAIFFELKNADIDGDLLIELNDSGMSFEEIADYLDRPISTNTTS